MVIIIWLFFICMGLLITYSIIKGAVKEAIQESLDDIQIAIINGINQSKAEYDWNKNNNK